VVRISGTAQVRIVGTRKQERILGLVELHRHATSGARDGFDAVRVSDLVGDATMEHVVIARLAAHRGVERTNGSVRDEAADHVELLDDRDRAVDARDVRARGEPAQRIDP
jgi:hypothetical protein